MRTPVRPKPLTSQPNRGGYFGAFGGRFVPETLMAPLLELERAYAAARRDAAFRGQLDLLARTYCGRPTPLYRAERLERAWGAARLYLKREDLLHTGAHKINNTLGQVLLALRMGKKRIVAETGAGQHGVATATIAARFGLECVVYMGEEDVRRQHLNYTRMQLLGATVRPVASGSRTLKDATNEAIRDWVTNVRTTFYVLGSVVGPHPYPRIVRDFQLVIGRETKAQLRRIERRLPDQLIACVGGGSNAIGLFHPFLRDPVRLVGVEAAGLGLRTDQHAASLARGKPGVLHGARSYLLQDRDGQVRVAHSVSAGLDYPGVGPEHAFLKAKGRAEYVAVTDAEALAAFREVARLEGLLVAFETAHALAEAKKRARRARTGSLIVIGCSGRGDKDVPMAAELFDL